MKYKKQKMYIYSVNSGFTKKEILEIFTSWCISGNTHKKCSIDIELLRSLLRDSGNYRYEITSEEPKEKEKLTFKSKASVYGAEQGDKNV